MIIVSSHVHRQWFCSVFLYQMIFFMQCHKDHGNIRFTSQSFFIMLLVNLINFKNVPPCAIFLQVCMCVYVCESMHVCYQTLVIKSFIKCWALKPQRGFWNYNHYLHQSLNAVICFHLFFMLPEISRFLPFHKKMALLKCCYSLLCMLYCHCCVKHVGISKQIPINSILFKWL